MDVSEEKAERPKVAQVIMDEERRRMEWERRQVEKAAKKAAREDGRTT